MLRSNKLVELDNLTTSLFPVAQVLPKESVGQVLPKEL